MPGLKRFLNGLVLALSLPLSTQAAENIDAKLQVEAAAQALVAALSSSCPTGDPASQAAFDQCRRSLYQNEAWRRYLPDFVLWGRQRNSQTLLKDTTLTQFGPDVFTSLYLPLFMFTGQYQVLWIEPESRYQIRAQTAFRGHLQPGQFPYPFWHEADKWSMYQRANEMIMWWDSDKQKLWGLQFTAAPVAPSAQASTPSTPAFDGRWMWTDESGKTQPMVTLFDGMFNAANPYLKPLDQAYQQLALRLREGQCNECHVPNNPNKMKRLVLLQTPAHAASEIQRLIHSIEKDRMPMDEAGIEQPLPQAQKEALLRDSKAFSRLYEAAKKWDTSGAQPSTQPISTNPK